MGTQLSVFGVRIWGIPQGFIVTRWQAEFPQARAQLQRWMEGGEIVHEETVMEGFESIPVAFAGLFRGANTGKMLVRTGPSTATTAATATASRL